jgi:hypothetical protein
MKCPCCNTELSAEFQVGDFVEVIDTGLWNGYRGFIMEVEEERLAELGCAYYLSVVDEDKNHIGLESWWDGPSLRLISGAGTYIQSYGELFNGV